MIQNTYIHRGRCLADLPGNLPVGLARTQVSGGVVMRQNNSDSPFLQGFSQNDPHIYQGPGDATLAELETGKHPVCIIQAQHPEFLVVEVGQEGPEDIV